MTLFCCNVNLLVNMCLFLAHFAENKYDFHPASVNLLAEFLKLLFCVVMSVWVIARGNQ